MTDLRVHKFTYSPDVIMAMDGDRRSAFLLLGLFLNEANWLQKLLIMGMPDERHDLEPELQSNLSLAILLIKLLAGKIHAGGERLRDKPLVDLLSALKLSDRGRHLESQLAVALQKDSTIHLIRKSNAFHYPRHLKLVDPIPQQEEIALYLTPFSGDTLLFLSDIAAVEALVSATGMDPQEWNTSFSKLLDEVIKVAGLYTEFLGEALQALMDEIPKKPEQQELLIPDARPLDAVRPKFFAFPASSQSEE
ncbi:MAG: hypothetical protein Q7T21_08530 [Gallionella sp.]|nr:hypothetical protein [Gallionella sp.]